MTCFARAAHFISDMGCPVHVSNIAKWCEMQFESQDSNPLMKAGQLFKDGQEVKDLVIPEGV